MSANEFKVGDIVKCVDNNGVAVRLTIGKEYEVVKLSDNDMIMVDNGERFYYFSYRFELSEGGTTTSSRTQHQPPKFKEGDMVYLIGFDCLKSHKLLSTGDNYLTMKFRVVIDDDNSKTFTKNGYYTTNDATPRIVLATEENRQMLNKLLGVEYEPVKLEGSDLARKLLKDKPQTCWVSDVSDNDALSNGCVLLIVEFGNGGFATTSGLWCRNSRD